MAYISAILSTSSILCLSYDRVSILPERKGCLIIDRWDTDNVQRHVSRNNFSAIIICDRCIYEPIYISVRPRRSLVYLAKERSYEKSDRNYFRLAKPSKEHWENGNSLSLPWHCSISICAFILFFYYLFLSIFFFKWRLYDMHSRSFICIHIQYITACFTKCSKSVIMFNSVNRCLH